MVVAQWHPDEITAELLSRKFPQLSRAEIRVLHWLIRGKTDEEIAIILGLARWTISTHVKHILQKLGLEKRYAIIREAICVVCFGDPPTRR